MAGDNLDVTKGAYDGIVAADNIGNVFYPRNKLVFGPDGVASDVWAENPLPVMDAGTFKNTALVSRFLDEDGDGGGNKEANGDYSAIPTKFFIAPPATKIYHLTHMQLQIRTNSTAVIDLAADKYGDLSALTNGVCLQVSNDTAVIKDLLDGVKVKTLEEWFMFCSIVANPFADYSPTNLSVSACYEFLSAGRSVVTLDGSQSEKLEIILNDNLTGLRGHRFLVKGFSRDVPT